jgi:16S rRNA (guanine527-N7)-methyltransferase
MPLAPTQQFLDAAATLGIEFDDGDLQRLGTYLELLLEANKTTNLTAIREPDAAWMRHILDSLTLLPALAELPEGATVIDVGSGGGLPGMPLAIALPHLRFTLLEATGKKAVFLRTTATTLGLSNVTILCERAEKAAHDRGERTGAGRQGGHREAYDAVVARAVGRLVSLAEITVPFAKAPSEGQAGGEVLLIKGQQADEEVEESKAALHALKAVHVRTFDTPTGRVIVLGKGAATPKLYPRRDGEPKRSPLGVRKQAD